MRQKALFILSFLMGMVLSFSFGADQPDFPLIYVDEGCAGTHVGSQANPYDDLADINWTTGGDNSIFDYLAGSPTQSPTIYLNKGDEWIEFLNIDCSGTATYPIIITSYGTGADPIVSRGVNLTGAAYDWEAGGGGTNEWYCTAAGGGDPGLGEPLIVALDKTTYMQKGTLDALDDHEWNWGDSDGLGYSTVYVRDDTGDPDTSGAVFDAGQGTHCAYEWARSYVEFDGIHFRFANANNIEFGGSTAVGIHVRNCTSDFCYGSSIEFRPSASAVSVTDSLIENNGGIGIVYVAGCSGQTTTGNTIRYNGLRETTKESGGIELTAAGTVIVADNVIHDNGNATPGNEGYAHGIYVQEGANAVSIYDNLIYNHAFGNAVKTRGTATIYRNILRDSYRAGYSLRDWDAQANTVTFYQNLVSGNYYGMMVASPGTGDLTLNIYNNVFYSNTDTTLSPTGFTEVRINDDPETLVIKNNMIAHTVTAADNWSYLIDGALTNATIDNNCVYEGQIYYNGANRTWAYWQGTAGFDANGIGDSTDPLMTNPGGADFTLQNSSPCIDAGTDVGLSTDYAGNPIPQGTGPDIGAYENQDVSHSDTIQHSMNFLAMLGGLI